VGEIARVRYLFEKYNEDGWIGEADEMEAEWLREGRLQDAVDLERMDDMTRPLADYFINTSHNSYLEGPQFFSRASAEAISGTLRSGSRVVELDCWESWALPSCAPLARPRQVIVTHGFAFTSACPFQQAIQAIRDHAFDTSEYPLLLTLENHCQLALQADMAATLETVLGDFIARPSEFDFTTASPNDLKRKVLIINEPKFQRSEDEKPQGLPENPFHYLPPNDFAHGIQIQRAIYTRRHFPDAYPCDSSPVANPIGRSNSIPVSVPAGSPIGRANSLSSPVSNFVGTLVSSFVRSPIGFNIPVSSPHGSLLRSPFGCCWKRDVTEEMRRRCDGLMAVTITEDKERMFEEPSGEGSDSEESLLGGELVITLALNGCVLTRTFTYDEPVMLGEWMLVHPALLRLCFASLRPFSSFSSAQGRHPLNMGEKRAKSAALKFTALCVESTRRRLHRVYPRGVRLGFEWWVAGHNLDPLYAWSVGCQMPAINMQCRDRAFHLNQGRFRPNRQAGFVLKPQMLRSGNSEEYACLMSRPQEALTARGLHSVLYLHLLGARGLETQLCSTKSKTYCVLDLCSFPQDNKKSRTRLDLGAFPFWNEGFLFPLTEPSLALIHIILLDAGVSPKTRMLDRILDLSQDVMLGHATLPVSRLKAGMCKVPLHDNNGDLLMNGEHLVLHIGLHHDVEFDNSLYEQLSNSKSMDYEMSLFLINTMGLKGRSKQKPNSVNLGAQTLVNCNNHASVGSHCDDLV